MGRGLFSLFFVVFGTVLIQAYIYRCHIIPPWLGGDNVTPLYVSWDEYSSGQVSHALYYASALGMPLKSEMDEQNPGFSRIMKFHKKRPLNFRFSVKNGTFEIFV